MTSEEPETLRLHVNQPYTGHGPRLVEAELADTRVKPPAVHQVAAYVAIVKNVLVIVFLMFALFLGGRVITALQDIGGEQNGVVPAQLPTAPCPTDDPYC